MRVKPRMLPLGVQSFEKLRQNGYVYVDKTKYIYDLVQSGTRFFLSRPRRFGKSLFVSALAAYWEGKRDLFKDLYIEGKEGIGENSWQSYPVFYFDFNSVDLQADHALEKVLDWHLEGWEKIYGLEKSEYTLAGRFKNLLLKAHEVTGLRCVVLVDEYDKPLMDVYGDWEKDKHYRDVLKGFFSVLKSFDKDLQFVFITGVTEFNKVSIFSDLNHLTDISLNDRFSGICGITEKEMIAGFKPEIRRLMTLNQMTREACLQKLKQTYDGYHFSGKGEAVFNPFSLLSAFWQESFGFYWFESGTPTFLVKRLRKLCYDVRQFSDKHLYATEKRISDYRAGEMNRDDEDLIPLFYQTGYLTIKAYQADRNRYSLGFPNEEVKYGFLDSLMPEYTPAVQTLSGKDIFSICEYIETGCLENVRDALTALYASISYTSQDQAYEHYFQIVIYLVFTLLNQYVCTEIHSALGRADCIVETEKYVYIFEFKLDKSADDALSQIEQQGYAKPYAADTRKLFRIGVNFDSSIRNISEWKVQT